MIATNIKRKTNRQAKRFARHYRVRQKIVGTAERPRLSLFKSREHLWAQLIDDVSAKTLVSLVDNSKAVREKLKGTKQEKAYIMGKLIAAQAKAKKISRVVFDRGGFLYHGRIRKFAEGAREGGLIF